MKYRSNTYLLYIDSGFVKKGYVRGVPKFALTILIFPYQFGTSKYYYTKWFIEKFCNIANLFHAKVDRSKIFATAFVHGLQDVSVPNFIKISQKLTRRLSTKIYEQTSGGQASRQGHVDSENDFKSLGIRKRGSISSLCSQCYIHPHNLK